MTNLLLGLWLGSAIGILPRVIMAWVDYIEHWDDLHWRFFGVAYIVFTIILLFLFRTSP